MTDKWELIEIYSAQILTLEQNNCSENHCENVGCVLYKKTDGNDEWLGCLDCQMLCFGGWPDNISEIPGKVPCLDPQTKLIMKELCTKFDSPEFFDFSPRAAQPVTLAQEMPSGRNNDASARVQNGKVTGQRGSAGSKRINTADLSYQERVKIERNSQPVDDPICEALTLPPKSNVQPHDIILARKAPKMAKYGVTDATFVVMASLHGTKQAVDYWIQMVCALRFSVDLWNNPILNAVFPYTDQDMKNYIRSFQALGWGKFPTFNVKSSSSTMKSYIEKIEKQYNDFREKYVEIQNCLETPVDGMPLLELAPFHLPNSRRSSLQKDLSKALEYFRNYWLLYPHLSRLELYKKAIADIKHIKKYEQVQSFLITKLKQVRLEKAVFELRLLGDTFGRRSKQFQDNEIAARRLRIILKHVGLSSEGDLLSLCDRLANEAYHAHFKSYEELKWIPGLCRDEVNEETDDVAATRVNAECDMASGGAALPAAPRPTSLTGSSDNNGGLNAECGTASGGASSSLPSARSTASLTGSSGCYGGRRTSGCYGGRRTSGKESGTNAAPESSANVPNIPRVSSATSLTGLSANNCARDTGKDDNAAPGGDDSGTTATSTTTPATDAISTTAPATDTKKYGSNGAPLDGDTTTDSTENFQNMNMDADSTSDSTDDFQYDMADADTSMDLANTTDTEDSPKADERAHHGPDKTSLESEDSSNIMGVGRILEVSKTIDNAPAPTIEPAHTGKDTGTNISAGKNENIRSDAASNGGDHSATVPSPYSGATGNGAGMDSKLNTDSTVSDCHGSSCDGKDNADETKNSKPAFEGASNGVQSNLYDSLSSTARVSHGDSHGGKNYVEETKDSKPSDNDDDSEFKVEETKDSNPSDNDDDSEYKGINSLLGIQGSKTDEKNSLLCNEGDLVGSDDGHKKESVSCDAFDALSRAVSVHEMLRAQSRQAQEYLKLLKCEEQCKRLGPSYCLKFGPTGVLTPYWYSPTKEWRDAHVWLFTILLEILHRAYSNADLMSIGKNIGKWKRFDSQYMYLMPFMKLGFVPPVFVQVTGAEIDEELEGYLAENGLLELLFSSVPPVDFDATLESIFSSLELWLAPCFLNGAHQNLMNATRLFDPDYMCYPSIRNAEIERVKTTIDAMMHYRSPEEKEATKLILEKFQASSSFFLNQVSLCRRILQVRRELQPYRLKNNAATTSSALVDTVSKQDVINDDNDDGDVVMKDDSRAIDKQCMEGHDSAGDNKTTMTVDGVMRTQGIGDNVSDAAMIDNVTQRAQSDDDGRNSNRGAESSLISESAVENHDGGGNRDPIINVAPRANKDSDDNEEVYQRTRGSNTSTTAIVDSTEAPKDNVDDDDDIEDEGDDFCSTLTAISATMVCKNSTGPSFVGQQAQPSSEQESMESFEDKTPTITAKTCAESLEAASCAEPQAMSPFRRVKSYLQMGAMDMASKFCSENGHSLNDTHRNELLTFLCENGHSKIIDDAFPSLRRRGGRKRKARDLLADEQDDLPVSKPKRKNQRKGAHSR